MTAASGRVCGSDVTFSGIGIHGLVKCTGAVVTRESTADEIDLTCDKGCDVNLTRRADGT